MTSNKHTVDLDKAENDNKFRIDKKLLQLYLLKLVPEEINLRRSIVAAVGNTPKARSQRADLKLALAKIRTEKATLVAQIAKIEVAMDKSKKRAVAKSGDDFMEGLLRRSSGLDVFERDFSLPGSSPLNPQS